MLAGMIVAAQAPSLNKAISLFNNLNDAGAARELRALLKRGPSDTEAARAHIYLGLIALNAIHAKEARDEFKQALTIDPMLELPRRASPKARLAFAEARHDLQVEMARPVQASPRANPAPGPSPNPEPQPMTNLAISPDSVLNPEPGPSAEPAPAPTPTPAPAPAAAQAPAPAPSPPPSPPPARARTGRSMILIPPPPPPSNDTSLVEEHAKEEPPPRKNHAASITLGTLTLAAGGFAIAGAVEVGRYNSTLADARNNPGKYSGATIASKENTAQIWQISAITLAVLSALGVTATVLTW